MKFANLFPLLIVITLISSCSHTNKLSQYELNNKNVLFKQIEEPNAKEVKLEFYDTPISGSSKEAQIDAVAGPGSTVISSSIEKRFEEGVNTDKLLDNIVVDIQKFLGNIFNIKMDANVNEFTNFIFETKLTKCQLTASNLGVTVTVEADAVIYDKKSTEIIWEYTGSGIIPIQKNKNMMLDQEHNSAISIVNTAELDRITDEQIQKSINSAVEIVKENIIDALSEDIFHKDN